MHIDPELLAAAFPYVGIIFTPLVSLAGALGGVALGEHLRRRNDDRTRASQREADAREQIVSAVAGFIAAARQLQSVVTDLKENEARREKIAPTFTDADIDVESGMQVISMVEEQRRDLVRRREALDDKMSTEAARLQLQAPKLFWAAGRVASTIESEPGMPADKLETLLSMLASQTAEFLDETESA